MFRESLAAGKLDGPGLELCEEFLSKVSVSVHCTLYQLGIGWALELRGGCVTWPREVRVYWCVD